MSDTAPEMLEKSERMAAQIKMFLPLVDMLVDDFDMEHARQMLHDMEGNASRYDTMAVLQPGGWQKHEQDLLRIQAQRLKAIIQLIGTSKQLRDNTVDKGIADQRAQTMKAVFGL